MSKTAIAAACLIRNPDRLEGLEHDRAAMHKPENAAIRGVALAMRAQLYAAGFTSDDQIALELDDCLGVHLDDVENGSLMEYSALGADVEVLLYRSARAVMELGPQAASMDAVTYWIDCMSQEGPTIQGSAYWH